MENPSVSTKNNKSENETHVGIGISEAERSLAYERTQRRILHRVPPQLRENKNHIYDPVIFSLGPYHYDKSPNSKFLPIEKFKNEVLNTTLDPTAQGDFRSKILERVDEIRIFYEGLSVDEYKDEELAEMMLRDTCFVLYYMEMRTGNNEKVTRFMRQLGLSVAIFSFRDMYILENQIPLWVLNLLISLIFDDKDEREAFFRKFLSSEHFRGHRLTKLPWEDKDEEPLHLLEALRRIMVEVEISSTTKVHRRRFFEINWWQKNNSQVKTFEDVNGPFRSVMDLKTKGICFGPSSYCLTDIRFKSYWFFGKLQLPIAYICNDAKVFVSNIIALEMSPKNDTDYAFLSYVNFLQSLLESPKDVKELRGKGILYSSLRNDEAVLKMLKEIDTYGTETNIFDKVKMRINEHCKSKGKTWMAELIHTKFRTPWTVIALLAAIFLLSLTFLQTYFTINPE